MTKDEILECIRALPDNATLEDVFARLCVLMKLEKDLQQAAGQDFELPTFRGNGLRPGVDLDRSVDLLDRMEEER